jgi:hypothetical protein
MRGFVIHKAAFLVSANIVIDMNENQQLRFLIRSILQEDATSLVGQHLWPNGRWTQDNGHEPPGPDEPDSEREAELRQKLQDYILDPAKLLSQRDVDDLVVIASDPRHKKTLSLYKKGQAWRGIQVSKAWFERNFGATAAELTRRALESGQPKRGEMILISDKPLTLKSTGVFSSWSKDVKTAADFATSGAVSHGVVFQADSKMNTFINLTKVYDVVASPDAGFRQHEKEVLAVGPVKVKAIYLCENLNMNDPEHEIMTRDDKYASVSRPGPWGTYKVKRSVADAMFDDEKRSDLDF